MKTGYLCFCLVGGLKTYLFRHSHDPGPPIQCGKTGHDLPVYTVAMADCDRDIFAAFTGPDGGITSISNTAEQGRTTETQLAGFNLADYSHKPGPGVKNLTSTF